MNPDSCAQAKGDYQEPEDYMAAAFDRAMNNGDLKHEVNKFLFLHANPKWTLGQAELAACRIIAILGEPVSNETTLGKLIDVR